MASTATNKQPLFVDRVFHYVKNLDNATNNGLDIAANNTAEVLVDASASDGAVVEDLYLISRSGTNTYPVNLYLSTARDFLRSNQAHYVGTITSEDTLKTRTPWDDMPKVLAPVAQTEANPVSQAFYVPKGYVLWAAREGNGNETDAPLVACQGGWY